ncbi:MAG: mannose-1-phosphate guanylyltransferase/mannose-6-phosphate isomerase [Desulfobacterales bacterium]|nr:mannose-1-phosphate guanylyltransferase/mannose-6-phosphate isomerase [Desulfobacterales bacterium]
MSEENIKAYPVLLAGGSGTRLWPVSRELFPKQLVRFFGNESLIQNTIKRLFPVFKPESIRIVCGKNHSHEISRDMEAVNVPADEKIINEPCGRNTAPAILLSVLNILKHETDAVIFIFPADHVIGNVDEFHEKTETAISLAKQNYIVTFGITPGYPETGYGYIEADETGKGKAFPIKRFVEKPDIKTAEQYLKAGNFFWNSGMFAFKASVIIEEFEKFQPDMLKQVREMVAQEELSFEKYSQVESISIDYAIMEKTDKGVVLPSDFGWSDIGSWKSLYDFLPKDKEQNVITTGDVILQNTRNSFIMGHERLIAVNSLDNLVVVETPDSVFVSDMENSRDVKNIVTTLKERGRSEYQVHTTVFHTWGYHKILEDSDDITVKRIVIYPESEITTLVHNGGTRQWLVVDGSARLTLDNASLVLEESESMRISEKIFHKLENTGKTELCLIETIKKS